MLECKLEWQGRRNDYESRKDEAGLDIKPKNMGVRYLDDLWLRHD